MVKKYIAFIFLLIGIITSAQNLTVVYEVKYKPSIIHKDSTKSKLFYLDIFNNESVFRDDMRRRSDSLIFYGNGYGLGYPVNINDQLYIKKDLNKHTVFKYLVLPTTRDIFYVKVNEKINWQLLPETKKIGDLKCQKALADYGGRHWTAWFTEDVQVSEGPYVFNGLPGMIVEINDSTEDYLFKLVKIKKSTDKNLFSMKGGKNVSWEEFIKIQNDYYKDPYSVIKLQNIKVMTDDGNGGRKNVNLRESTISIQTSLKEYNNIIELNQKADFK
ncbi:GLPGLI family protein [Chryseobacterium vrystaatense]|uniref:GLPGLI family protein n=1 Tax=Chryseobacterium vrystaatense TaxID=307480 RepID=A0ABR4UJ60_9FLAO|nr:GLPGLI family protein [Chryseobacterium vrystaatense]KFF24764.1 hypothetical protein IW16_17670 [Chryseobacterium vrystaatense]